MRHASALILSALCAISVAAAQTPAQPVAPQQQPPQKPAAAASPAEVTKVTYSGCLKPGATADSWMLENAEIASAAGAAAKSGTAGTSGTASPKMTLGLTVKPTQNLKPHANHKIEVVGTLSGPAGVAATASGAAASGATAAAPRQTLTIESFKMVSATCP